MGHRYFCPYSRCGRGCWTAWGIKRHVKRHIDDLHARFGKRPGLTSPSP